MTDIPKKWKTGENPEIVIEQITFILRFWGRKATQLEIGLILLGTVSIVSALAVGAFADLDFMKYQQSLPLKVLGFLSALCLTLINSFNMSDRANRVRKAWRHLNKALYRYNSDIVDIKKVILAYDEGEEMIGSTVEFSYSKS